MDRRTFLSRITALLSAGIASLMSLPVFSFISGAAKGREEAGWQTIISINSSALSEEINKVTFNRVIREGWLTRIIQDSVWVRRNPDNTFVVYEPHCTHLGCAYAWSDQDQLFECPCHGGKFNKDGKVMDGPPPRPLDRFETRVEGNQLKIGKVLKA